MCHRGCDHRHRDDARCKKSTEERHFFVTMGEDSVGFGGGTLKGALVAPMLTKGGNGIENWSTQQPFLSLSGCTAWPN